MDTTPRKGINVRKGDAGEILMKPLAVNCSEPNTNRPSKTIAMINRRGKTPYVKEKSNRETVELVIHLNWKLTACHIMLFQRVTRNTDKVENSKQLNRLIKTTAPN